MSRTLALAALCLLIAACSSMKGLRFVNATGEVAECGPYYFFCAIRGGLLGGVICSSPEYIRQRMVDCTTDVTARGFHWPAPPK